MASNNDNSIARLALALCLAQADIKDAKTNKKNAFIGNSYADLTAVWQACRKALTDHDLAVVQRFKTEDGELILETILMHTSGETISSELPLMLVKDWHSLGSGISYARRYSLCALVGITPDADAPDADDDGAKAQEDSKKAPVAGSRKSYPKRKKKEEKEDKGFQESRTLGLETIKEKAMSILNVVPEADEYLRNKDVDPADPPAQILETIVKLGPEGIRKKITDSLKEAKKKEMEEKAKEIAANADRVEPLEEDPARDVVEQPEEDKGAK
mgnify:CR=1 FL=1|tara:strand:- start:2217 stop:3032 length:816 start_codon:yes stop_codon:yes gene_type:complete